MMSCSLKNNTDLIKYKNDRHCLPLSDQVSYINYNADKDSSAI